MRWVTPIVRNDSSLAPQPNTSVAVTGSAGASAAALRRVERAWSSSAVIRANWSSVVCSA